MYEATITVTSGVGIVSRTATSEQVCDRDRIVCDVGAELERVAGTLPTSRDIADKALWSAVWSWKIVLGASAASAAADDASTIRRLSA